MKKLLLTAVTACAILFAQAQSPCDSLTVSGSQNQLTLTSVGIIDFWETTAPDGTILGQDSLWNMHSVYNNSSSGIPYDTITTCLYTMNTVCCVVYIWNGSSWSIPGNPVPSWDCSPNMIGCFDPGTGTGQYTSLSACQTACSVTASWECDQVNGCYDPGTGIGQYSSLSACQSVCSSVSTSPCDSLTITSTGGSMQTQLLISLNSSGLPAYIDYWVTTSNDGTLLGEDSLATSHNVYNFNPISTLPYDTINTCLSYTMNTPSVITCCVTWIWNGSFWAKMGSVTSVGEINFDNKKLIKIVDVLGRETFPKNNEILFYIYEDGTIDKRYITTKNK